MNASGQTVQVPRLSGMEPSHRAELINAFQSVQQVAASLKSAAAAPQNQTAISLSQLSAAVAKLQQQLAALQQQVNNLPTSSGLGFDVGVPYFLG